MAEQQPDLEEEAKDLKFDDKGLFYKKIQLETTNKAVGSIF